MVVCNYWYLLNWFSSNLFLTEIFQPGVFPRPIPTSREPGTGYLSNGKVPRHIFPGFESTLCICLHICLLGWQAQGLIALYFFEAGISTSPRKKKWNFYWENYCIWVSFVNSRALYVVWLRKQRGLFSLASPPCWYVYLQKLSRCTFSSTFSLRPACKLSSCPDCACLAGDGLLSV